MNTLVFAMLVACATAQYAWPYAGHYGRYVAAPYTAPAYWTPALANQYHAQDSFGQAVHGYAYPGTAAHNVRDAAGNQVGSYAYINPEGKEVKVSYTADHNGFRVLSNNLPVAPVFDGKAPEPVKDTPEVAAAKAEHMKALSGKREKRQIWTPYTYHRTVATPLTWTAPVAYTAPVAVAAAPIVAKSTVNTLVLEKDEKAKTPADTNKLNEKIVSHDVYTPVAHSFYPFAHHVAPWAVAAVEKPKETTSDDDSIKVESARKRRQVLALPYGYVANHKAEEFKNDFEYSSVDLNRDGQPDNKPLFVNAWTAPYTFGYSYPFLY